MRSRLRGFSPALTPENRRGPLNHIYGYAFGTHNDFQALSLAEKIRVLVQYAGVRPESYVLSKRVKSPPSKPGREGVTESCVRIGNDGFEA